MTTTPAPAFTARSPEDLLAVVPVVLGFHPEESVVLLTFGATRPFHARVDLPGPAEAVDELVPLLLGPALRHGVRRAAFVVWSGDAERSRSTARVLVRAFTGAGVDVVDALRAHAGRWWGACGDRPGVPACGVPYDVSAHRFAARAVVEGRVTLPSRAALAATLEPDPGAVAAVAAAAAGLPGGEPTIEVEGAWAADLVEQHVLAGTVPGAAELARLLVGMLDLPVRDAAWGLMSRPDAVAHQRFWTDVVRASPPGLVAGPAALLAFAAWLSGHGALAWCALDRCEEAAPGYRLAGYLAQALTQAVPPSVWEADGA